MSITTPVSQAIASTKRRTWRMGVESPSGQSPVISGFRETLSLDASGNQVGPSSVSQDGLRMALTPAAIAALPAKYQVLPGLLKSFFDDFESGALDAALAATAPEPAAPAQAPAAQ
jgi:hypothetical protein